MSFIPNFSVQNSGQVGDLINWVNPSHITKFDPRLVKRYFSNVPSHWVVLLFPFETSKPERYYSEACYSKCLLTLQNSFDKDNSLFKCTLESIANQLDSAYSTYLRSARTMRTISSDIKVDRETRFRQYIFPLYQEMYEGVWRALARILVIAIENPRHLDIEKYVNYRSNVISDKLKSKSFQEVLGGWDNGLRNNIAHLTFEFPEDALKGNVVLLHDPQDREIFDFEIDRIVKDFFDTCSAMMYATLRYLAIVEASLYPLPIGTYIRSQIVATAINEKRIRVLETSTANTRGSLQRNLKVNYAYRPNMMAFQFAFYLLKLAVQFLPAEKYFIVMGHGNSQMIWILTDHSRAQSFLNGSLNIDGYLATGDIQVFVESKLLGRKVGKLMLLRFLPEILGALQPIFKREYQFHRGWAVYHERDFSVGVNGRYEIAIVLHRNVSEDEIRSAIKAVIRKKRAVFRTFALALWDVGKALFKKRIKVRKVTNVVLVTVWTKGKRPDEMGVNPHTGQDNCICCAEWNRNTDFQWFEPKSNDENSGDLTIRWFQRGGVSI